MIAGTPAGTYTNNVSVVSQEVTSPVTASAQTVVGVTAPLAIKKTPLVQPAVAGDGVTYSYVIEVTNGGEGYTSPPQIVFVNDPREGLNGVSVGYNAAAVATLTGAGTVTAVVCVDHGVGGQTAKTFINSHISARYPRPVKPIPKQTRPIHPSIWCGRCP